MTSRERIFAKVRAGLAAAAPRAPDHEESRHRAVERRLQEHPRGLVPARARDKTVDERIGLLRHWLELAGGDVVEVAAPDAVPAAIAHQLRHYNLPLRVKVGFDDPLLGAIGTAEEGLEISRGPAGKGDTASLTRAVAAIAETGTVLVASGPSNPVTLSFLPEVNFVAVDRADVVGSMEDAFAKLGTRDGAALPRTLNMISGPSRSADIGGVPVLGAHGPRRLCVIVVRAPG